MFKKPEVKRLNNCISNNSKWCRDAIAFEVKNGLGKLVHAKNGCNSQLLLNGKPLIQGRYLASPTCFGMLATGYGIEKVDCAELNKIREQLNLEYQGIDKAFESINPLLKLLNDGGYILADAELSPTNGDVFFYNVPNELTENEAACDAYFCNELMSCTDGYPAYMYPTQSVDTISEDRVEYYRQRLKAGDNIRGLAYYEKGFICALLDGHHKAVAAAQLGLKLKCLVIIPPTAYYTSEDGSKSFCGISVPDCQNFDSKKHWYDKLRVRIKKFKLTDNRYGYLNASASKNYPRIKDICFYNSLDSIKEDLTAKTIENWIDNPDDKNVFMLKGVLRCRVNIDSLSTLQIAEKVISADDYRLPYEAAWRVIVENKNEDTEKLAVDYLVEHTAGDRCWDIVNSYWD